MSEVRHKRQVRLAEIGEAGQARIYESDVAVRGRGFAAVVEARYLAGAGVRTLLVPDEDARAAAERIDDRVRVELKGASGRDDEAWITALHPAAREVASGAMSALETLRALVLTEGDA